MIDSDSADFFVLAHERGHEVDALPLWAGARPDLVQFDDDLPPVERVDLSDLPGIFQLHP